MDHGVPRPAPLAVWAAGPVAVARAAEASTCFHGLDHVAEAYAAMDERRAIKSLLPVSHLS